MSMQYAHHKSIKRLRILLKNEKDPIHKRLILRRMKSLENRHVGKAI
jgi:hypothetical protein